MLLPAIQKELANTREGCDFEVVSEAGNILVIQIRDRGSVKVCIW